MAAEYNCRLLQYYFSKIVVFFAFFAIILSTLENFSLVLADDKIIIEMFFTQKKI